MKNLIFLLVIGFSASMITSCQNAPKGDKAVTEAAKKVTPSTAAKTYNADTGYSQVLWTGSKKNGSQHTGTLNLSAGTVDVAITGVNNGTVTGNLTLNGVTKSISFPGSIDISERGVTLATNDFTINRTDFGMKYGSASFFDNLKDKAINDAVGLKIKFRAS